MSTINIRVANSIKNETPNAITLMAFEESEKIAHDESIKGFANIDELKKTLDV